MSDHEYKPSSKIGKWFNDRLPLLSLANHLTDYPTPKNLNYWWTFGGILTFCLIAQIVTGITLAMHYVADSNLAFGSVEHIMRDVNYGWLIRYIHANGASMFFLAVYIHIFRALYYGSYKSPREVIWIIGMIIYLLMMMTAFMGYVLPWGQMSFWGATVITNLFSAIPFIGEGIVSWLWGGFSVEGGGEYRVFKNGNIFEKVGVNFSKVYGKFPKKFQKNIPGASKNPRFWASGISVVMHMKNPLIPAMHFNTRYICTTKNWFGGGIDVTQSSKDNSEKNQFHRTLKEMCDRHNKTYYKKYKKWCDEYFYLPHRNEARGIGGIFFDYKKDNFENDFKFIRDVGITFQIIFNNIIKKKIKKKWTLKDKEMQYIKRGRYAEFNLLYDRGTKFGLQTGGNIEGILMSLPPIVKWK